MRYTVEGVSLALDISRRTVAYYRSGEQTIPKVVELACEALTKRRKRT